MGNSPIVYSLHHTTLKHLNYFQIVLDQSVVLNEYVSLFFSSDLGRLVLESLYGCTIFPPTTKKDLEQVSIPIPSINDQTITITATKKDLEQVSIPIPSINDQRIIITANHKLEKLEKAIDEFKSELSLNPKSAISIQDNKIDDILMILDSLSDVDRIRSLIRKGESKTLEFKQTFSLNIHTCKKDKNIEKSSLKTIVAFLNTDGGNLLIGVDDEGNVTGLGEEMAKFHKNEDKFLLHFKDLIKDKIGEGSYPFIEYRIVDIDKAKVLFVECKSSTSPCYYDEEEFFVRVSPATDQLKGPNLVEYIENHFPK